MHCSTQEYLCYGTRSRVQLALGTLNFRYYIYVIPEIKGLVQILVFTEIALSSNCLKLCLDAYLHSIVNNFIVRNFWLYGIMFLICPQIMGPPHHEYFELDCERNSDLTCFAELQHFIFCLVTNNQLLARCFALTVTFCNR